MPAPNHLTRPNRPPRGPRKPVDVALWATNNDPIPVDAWTPPHTGYHPRSWYAERYWLPVIGPSGLALYRRLHWLVTNRPVSRFEVPLRILAAECGLWGPHSPVAHTLARLVDYGLAKMGSDTYLVRLGMPDVDRHQHRLPEHLRTELIRANARRGGVPLQHRPTGTSNPFSTESNENAGGSVREPGVG